MVQLSTYNQNNELKRDRAADFLWVCHYMRPRSFTAGRSMVTAKNTSLRVFKAQQSQIAIFREMQYFTTKSSENKEKYYI